MHGVKIRFLNRDDLLGRLQALARQLTRENRRVMEVHLFGSLSRGNHAPGSDADIFILLEEDSRRFIDRIPEFQDFFTGAGIQVEAFPYTVKEVQQMQDRTFMKNILRDKIPLATRSHHS